MKVCVYGDFDAKVRELKPGECFMSDGVLYMRVQKCRHETEDWKFYNVVRVATGELADFAEESLVARVEARAVVE